ncbi:MAG: transcriptional regulator [Chloroflexi bacterium]|nr:transcriptional regulator [Chloroflexota bacterium]
MSDGGVVLDETIHQPTRLRIMTLLVSQPGGGRLAYGHIQGTLDLTGGNLTTHLRRLERSGLLAITKEFRDRRPRTWVEATEAGRRAFADYLDNLQRALGRPVRG